MLQDENELVDYADDGVFEYTESVVNAGMSYETDPVLNQYPTENGIKYPCVYIAVSSDAVRVHQMQALLSLTQSERSDTRFEVYIDIESDVSHLGTIDSVNLKSLLTSSIFQSWGITLRTDVSTIYDGDMRLAFCSAVDC